MTLIWGVALVLMGTSSIYYSMPRGGKVARFVGSEWEGYVVVSFLTALGVGLVLIASGLGELPN